MKIYVVEIEELIDKYDYAFFSTFEKALKFNSKNKNMGVIYIAELDEEKCQVPGGLRAIL